MRKLEPAPPPPEPTPVAGTPLPTPPATSSPPIDALPEAPLPVLSCRQLSRWYGDVIGLNDLTVDIDAGITGLLGPNGSGKSTLMKLVMGLIRPSIGHVRVLGQDPWDNPGLLRRIGYVPEGEPPWTEKTGLGCAKLSAELYGLSPEAAAAAAQRTLAEVGLTDQADRPIGAYSRGMRQKLKFALALIHEPDLLILDEPLLGTDPPTRRDLIRLIRDLAAHGRSVLISTHVLPDIEALTQRILLLNRGRMMAYGQVARIRDLLEGVPRSVLVTTPKPRELGAAVWGLESVLSIQTEAGAILVKTNRAPAFYEQLQELLLQQDLPVTSISSPDESIESIFRYLVG